MDWTAAAVTLKVAAATTAVLLVLGLPLAAWLATTRMPGKSIVEAAVALPLLLPPTVLGFYVLRAEAATGSGLPFTFGGILVGSVLFNLPFAVRPFVAAIAEVNPRLVEASWCLGVSRLATFLRVVVPLAMPGILAGAVLTFGHTIGEFGVVLMVGGNIPGVTRTLSIAVYDDVQALDYAAAGRTALVLVAFAFAVLLAVQLLPRRAVAR
ncbi:MAG TPA: molybdate ABC transporter permease subunit [Gemmataceae bacterium]|nr:molybdate ABC transporter permease subunit [Gemmataceae bacterium]